MNALEIIREKKRRGELLPALETVIWEVCWEGINDQDVHQMKRAETAAEELATKDARIAELEKVFKEIAKVCKVPEFPSPRHALYKFQELISALNAIKHGVITISPEHSYGDYTQKKITTLQQATEYAAEVLEQVKS